MAKERSREATKTCRRERPPDEQNLKPCADPLASIRLHKEPKRYYPKRQLGAQLIGLVGKNGQGTEGIERAANGLLTGGQHTTRAIRDTRGRQLLLEGIPEEITEEELDDTQIFEEPPPKCPRPTRSCLPAWVVREYKSQRRSRVPQGVVPKAAL